MIEAVKQFHNCEVRKERMLVQRLDHDRTPVPDDWITPYHPLPDHGHFGETARLVRSLYFTSLGTPNLGLQKQLSELG